MGLLQKAQDFLRKKTSKAEESLPEQIDVPEEWEREAEQESRLPAIPEEESSFEPQEKDPYLFADETQLSTLPVTGDINQQARIEALMSLLELSKELASVTDEDDLWSDILFGIIGQLGVKQVALFFLEQGKPVLKASRGFEISEELDLPNRSGIARALEKTPEIFYPNEMLKKIGGPEKKWLSSLPLGLVVPIVHAGNVRGFILVGKALAGEEFHPDDLLYLKICGELVAAFHQSIQRVLFYSQQKRIWSERESRFVFLSEFLKQTANYESIQEAEKDLSEMLTDGFGVQVFALLRREEDSFAPLISSGLKHESVERLKAPITAPWLWEARHRKDWYSWKEFRKDPDLSARLKNEDLSIAQSLTILPLYFRSELAGVFLLFELESPLGSEALMMLRTALASLFHMSLANQFLDKSNSSYAKALKDPLYPIKKLIREKEAELEKDPKGYSLLSIQISNQGRLNKLLGAEEGRGVRTKMRALIGEELSSTSYLSEFFPGHFLAIENGWDRSMAWTWSKKLSKKIKKNFPDENTRPIIRTKILARPEDPFMDLDIFLFD